MDRTNDAAMLDRMHAKHARTAGVSDPPRQAYRVLHVAFVILPTLVGIDKFFHRITDWNGYLAPSIAAHLPVSVNTAMRATGVVEIVAGAVVAVKPSLGGYVVAAWLAGIVANLLIARDFYDVALRDVVLMAAAFALARLAVVYEGERAHAARAPFSRHTPTPRDER